jgi:hypothetical protein
MIERIVQGDRRGEEPATRNRNGAARRGHCGPGDDGGVEKMAGKRRKWPSAAHHTRIRSCPQIPQINADTENALEQEQTERTEFFSR